ncbi:MAG: DsbE family thiol:disulfide interchange protein [Rhodanobacteraceae bacterium]|nr:MAG: DsbE family thiol:disulfide interchange protein [Rhodanobacteraceae bacterium]
MNESAGKPVARLVPLIAFAALVAFFVVGLVWNQTHDARFVPSPLINKPAPAFNLPRLENPTQLVSKANLLGQPYLLNVFASWCFACAEEHPTLMAYRDRFGIPLIGYDYKDAPADARGWLQKHGDPYHEVITDQSGETALDFGIYGAPETYLIDAQGIIRYKHIGPLTPAVIAKDIEPRIRELKQAGA